MTPRLLDLFCGAGGATREALGIDWTDHQPALSQAIPPAYTEWIGAHLLALLG